MGLFLLSSTASLTAFLAHGRIWDVEHEPARVLQRVSTVLLLLVPYPLLPQTNLSAGAHPVHIMMACTRDVSMAKLKNFSSRS